METAPDVAKIASLIGDRARATMLMGLMGGKALTATELARAANITKQTASSHLAKLVDAALVESQSVGRYRYFALADHEVAMVIEKLIALAHRIDAVPVRTGPAAEAIRKARVCYDHLAGELGVRVYDSLKGQRIIRVASGEVTLTEDGAKFIRIVGIDIDALNSTRRPLCLSCLDWSVRRHHLAGALGAAILQLCFSRKWATRQKGTRAVLFSAIGERALFKQFVSAG